MDDSVVFASWHQCAPHVIRASLDPSESKSQTASRSVQPFLHSSPLILYNRPPLFPSELSLRMGDLNAHLLHYASLGPSEFTTHETKRCLDRFSRFCRAHDRDKPTDRQTTRTQSVTICRTYVRILRCGLKSKTCGFEWRFMCDIRI